jgi:hypothetical protein
MAKAFDTWTVLAHKPIQKHADNLWTVVGSMPDGRTQRVMTLARRSNGAVVIHNAIALDEPSMKEVEAFGNLHTMVVPNAFHRQDARIFKQRYDSLRVICPKGATKGVRAVVAVDGSYDDAEQDSDVKLEHLAGMKDGEGVLVVKTKTGTTLVFNDAVMNMPKLGFPMGFMLGPTGQVAVPRVMRWFLLKDRHALAAHFERLAEIPDLERIVVSHGAAITDGASHALRALAAQMRS